MRYFIKATEDYGAPYIRFEDDSGYPLSFKTELKYATKFTSIGDVVNALVKIGSRANIEDDELTIKGIETISILQETEVEL